MGDGDTSWHPELSQGSRQFRVPQMSCRQNRVWSGHGQVSRAGAQVQGMSFGFHPLLGLLLREASLKQPRRQWLFLVVFWTFLHCPVYPTLLETGLHLFFSS